MICGMLVGSQLQTRVKEMFVEWNQEKGFFGNVGILKNSKWWKQPKRHR